jgi:hypothetical protein
MNINIMPNPIHCVNISGGVNSVVFDHAVGFLAAGHSINEGDGLNIVHAIAQDVNIDVYHCHGLYPIGKNHFDPSYSRLNQIVLDNALRAKVTICISEFSANILRHRLHIDPVVTRNGIWLDDYKRAGSPSGPVLFPKATLDANAKAEDVIWLRQNSDINLLSIAKIQGVKSLGSLSRQDFLKTLQGCAIYIGTTKENCSMATMEAMISGVPVVGYNTGFSKEWLISGTGCELVPPGDRIALKDAINRVLANWKSYSKAARDYAEIFDWQPVINELLGIYDRVGRESPSQKVSIIIPCHNYGQWVGEAIESALAQTVPCEVIVIDDRSTDNSQDVINRYAKRVRVLVNEHNLGVAETRNRAIVEASGDFIVCLDADDRLHPDFVEKHLSAFHGLEDAIAYAPIELIDATGEHGKGRLFRAAAIPAMQRAGKNQIPSCCMFRKSFWVRAGGYEKRYSPAEDAHLWLKIFTLGGLPRRATSEPLMDYRMHSDSLSSKGFPNWWSDLQQLSPTAPIVERDPHITVVLDKIEGAYESLWSLENQDLPNWAANLPVPNNLSQTFPWLNKSTSRQSSVLQIPSGTILPRNFLSEYAAQPVEWMQAPRVSSLSSSLPISKPIKT